MSCRFVSKSREILRASRRFVSVFLHAMRVAFHVCVCVCVCVSGFSCMSCVLCVMPVEPFACHVCFACHSCRDTVLRPDMITNRSGSSRCAGCTENQPTQAHTDSFCDARQFFLRVMRVLNSCVSFVSRVMHVACRMLALRIGFRLFRVACRFMFCISLRYVSLL